MTRIGLAVAGAMMLGRGPAVAQGVRYGVGAGLLVPVGDYHSLDKVGWIAGADVTYWLASASLGIRAEGSYSRTGQRPGACCLSDHTTTFAGGMVDLVYAFGRRADQVRAYLLGGVGVYSVRISAPGFSPSTDTKIGFAGGGGVAYRVGKGNTQLFLEGKVGNVTLNGVHLVSIPIRIGLRLGAR